MDTSRLFSLIESRSEELYSLLSSLIRYNSESFSTSGNEEAVARYIDGLCRELSLESELYSPLDLPDFKHHPDYMEGRGLENRYNVTARWRGHEDKDEVLLLAHTDTVRIGDRANWQDDPLSGRIADGRIYGRGANDDKYAIATVLFLIKLLRDAGFVPKRNLLFSAYCDEEYGGSHGALAAVLRTPCPRIISMDGRAGQIWNCGSGGGEVFYRYHVEKTVDSAKAAAEAIPVMLRVLDEFGKNRYEELEANPYYKGTIIPPTSLRYMGIRAGNYGADLGTCEALFTYYTDKTREEMAEEFAAFEKKLSEALAPLGIVGDGFTPNTRFFHYVSCPPDTEDIRMLLTAAEEAGRPLRVCGSCLSDLSVIAKYSPKGAVAFGAGRDFSQPGGPHQPNEFIECDAFLTYTKTIAAYLLKVLG